MLIQAFRDNIPKWVTGFILVVIIGPFALWGINSYFTASSDNSVATVNGDSIAVGDFQRYYQDQYARMEQFYGQAFKPEMIDEKKLRQEVLDQLIAHTVLSQQVAAHHYTVSDKDLVDAIQKMPVFQVAGKFSAQAYDTRLAESSVSAAEFERRERQDMATMQLQTSIGEYSIATSEELASAYAVRGQQRQVSWMMVSARKFLPGIKVSDADVQSYYDAHKNDFMTPEKVTLDFVELDEVKLASQVQPSEADLQALYQQQIDKYKQDESRDARHILIAVNGNDPKADAAAKSKAEDILKQIKAGADFAKLAEQYSDDPGSKKQGGELGQVSRGVMVKPFEEALFSLAKPGDIAGPVRSQFGYHIIQLEGINAPQVKPYSQVRAELLADYQKKKADDQYFSLGDQLANLAYEHSGALDAVSKQLDLPVQTTADVTRDAGEGIGANADVRKAAFSDEVLVQGKNSEPITIGPNHSVVIRVKGHVPSEPKVLADVRGAIVLLLQQQRAAEAAAKLASALLTSIDKGGDAVTLAKSNGAAYTAPAFVTRNQQGIPAPVLDAAFAASGSGSSSVVPLEGGDQAVVIVGTVKPGAVAGLQDSQRQAALRELSREDGASEYAAYIAYLRSQAKIKINTKNIEQSSED